MRWEHRGFSGVSAGFQWIGRRGREDSDLRMRELGVERMLGFMGLRGSMDWSIMRIKWI